MMSLVAAVFPLVFSLNLNAQAAVWTCAPDPAACPNGNHIRCIGHGWCGPNCDFCQTEPEPTPSAPPAAQETAATQEEAACDSCYSQVQPDQFCQDTCGCHGIFCDGRW